MTIIEISDALYHGHLWALMGNGRSYSGGLDVRYMVPMKRHLPDDYTKVVDAIERT